MYCRRCVQLLLAFNKNTLKTILLLTITNLYISSTREQSYQLVLKGYLLTDKSINNPWPSHYLFCNNRLMNLLNNCLTLFSIFIQWLTQLRSQTNSKKLQTLKSIFSRILFSTFDFCNTLLKTFDWMKQKSFK